MFSNNQKHQTRALSLPALSVFALGLLSVAVSQAIAAGGALSLDGTAGAGTTLKDRRGDVTEVNFEVIIIDGGTGKYRNLEVKGLPHGVKATLGLRNRRIARNYVVISGTAKEKGTYNLTVSVQDSAGAKASRNYTLGIDIAGKISPSTCILTAN